MQFLANTHNFTWNRELICFSFAGSPSEHLNFGGGRQEEVHTHRRVLSLLVFC